MWATITVLYHNILSSVVKAQGFKQDFFSDMTTHLRQSLTAVVRSFVEPGKGERELSSPGCA